MLATTSKKFSKNIHPDPTYLGVMPNLPVNKLNHVIFFAAPKDLEPFKVAHVGLFIFAKSNSSDDCRTWF